MKMRQRLSRSLMTTVATLFVAYVGYYMIISDTTPQMVVALLVLCVGLAVFTLLNQTTIDKIDDFTMWLKLKKNNSVEEQRKTKRFIAVNPLDKCHGKEPVAALTPILIECLFCKKKFSSRASHCPQCGTESQELISCQICAETIGRNTVPCPNCGDPSPNKPLLDNIFFEYVYYIHEKAVSPVSFEEIHELFKTSAIDKETRVCKKGLENFQPIIDVPNLWAEITAFECNLKSVNKALIECPECQKLFSERALSCPKCCFEEKRLCSVCSEMISTRSTACTECGDPDPFPMI